MVDQPAFLDEDRPPHLFRKMSADRGDEPYALEHVDDFYGKLSTTRSSVTVTSNRMDEQEVWQKVLKEHVMEFGEDYSDSVLNLLNEMQINNISLRTNWIPTRKAPFDIPPYITFLDFEQNLHVDPPDSKKIESRFTTFSSRLGCEKWNEFIADVNSIYNARRKSKDAHSSSYLRSLYSISRSIISKGNSRRGHARQLPAKLLDKWSDFMEQKNISILLFYNPGQLEKKKTPMKRLGNNWANYNEQSYFGFVLQMHFDLVDVKNHFNGMKASDKRVDLDNKILTIRSVYRRRWEEDDYQGSISQGIEQSLRKGRGPTTPTLASNINCVCYNYEHIQGVDTKNSLN